jgi:hypothetical protein
MDDIVFLYDQVVEMTARMHAFCSIRTEGLPGDGDVEDDIDQLTLLLAKRDLLTLAGSMRNFSEASNTIQVAKSEKIQISEVFVSAGPPFLRDTKQRISVYQWLSRILHAYDLRILRTPTDFYLEAFGTGTEYFSRIAAYINAGSDPNECGPPPIKLRTEKERLTFVRLDYSLIAVCKFLNAVSDQLSKKKIFLQRNYR